MSAQAAATATASVRPTALYTGTIVYVEKGYGFMTDLEVDGQRVSGQFFVRNGTLRENKRNKVPLAKLHGTRVTFLIRQSQHWRHARHWEAWDVKIPG